jgi:hypothetical protein
MSALVGEALEEAFEQDHRPAPARRRKLRGG